MLEFALLLMGASINANVIKQSEEKFPGETTFTVTSKELSEISAKALMKVMEQMHEAEKKKKEESSDNPEDLINKGLDLMNKKKGSDHPLNA